MVTGGYGHAGQVGDIAQFVALGVGTGGEVEDS